MRATKWVDRFCGGRPGARWCPSSRQKTEGEATAHPQVAADAVRSEGEELRQGNEENGLGPRPDRGTVGQIEADVMADTASLALLVFEAVRNPIAAGSLRPQPEEVKIVDWVGVAIRVGPVGSR